ncbi:MAG: molybdenum cofactor guanylyltransferase [Solirubrobacterales bacterium]
MEADSRKALGAVLAGGRGSRLGGAKAWVELGGRPLYSYPLAAIEAAGLDPVVCVKRSESRGSFCTYMGRKEPRNEVAVLEEPDEPRHPLAGIVAALRAGRPDGVGTSSERPGAELGEPAAARSVIAVACDMPFVSYDLLALLAEVNEPLIVPVLDGRLQPLLGRYDAVLLPELEAALEREEPLTRTVESLRPRLLDEQELSRFGDPHRLLFNVNDPDDLREAEKLL